MSQFDYKASYRRHLPHIQPPGATLFVTYRLAGSIPAEIVRQLRDERIAALVTESLHYLNNQRYTLEAFCIMPNHVHVVFTPLATSEGVYYSMANILHSLKRYTALHANQILERQGSFWQDETYDHVVRDEPESNRIVEYILNNPVSAGLVSSREKWRWAYCRTNL